MVNPQLFRQWGSLVALSLRWGMFWPYRMMTYLVGSLLNHWSNLLALPLYRRLFWLDHNRDL
jgi:hypothetical protein